MPCDTVRTTTLDLGKLDMKLLEAALKELGLNPRTSGKVVQFTGGYYANGAITTTRGDAESFVSEIKQAYSAQVVTNTAKRFGWQCKEVGKYQYEVTKR